MSYFAAFWEWLRSAHFGCTNTTDHHPTPITRPRRSSYTHLMNRRQFLYTSAAGLALSATAAYADDKPRRVGLIGPGWYGKTDLFRLIQVAPVEIVSLCDVDKQMLARAADQIGR